MKRDRLVFRWPGVGRFDVKFEDPTLAKLSYIPSPSVILKTIAILNKRPSEGSKERASNYPPKPRTTKAQAPSKEN